MPLPECTRVPFFDVDTSAHLLANGWREIEVLETWYGPAQWEKGEIIEATEEHRERLMTIARTVFFHDRLHQDPMVDQKYADEFKAKCISDALDDPERIVFMDRDQMAFLSLRINGRIGTIDLVASMMRGKARELIRVASWECGLLSLEAGTQETNAKAKALYSSLGMHVVGRQRTFHR